VSGPCAVLDAGEFSLWCRACPWRTTPTPVGADVAGFRAVRAAAELAWRDHHDQAHQTAGAPAGRLSEVGPVPPTNTSRAVA